ncbi:hypothetical protein V6N13_029609 [Hibiscus sabdariffa]
MYGRKSIVGYATRTIANGLYLSLRPLNNSGGSKSWLAPSEDTLKFNTYAAVKASFGKAFEIFVAKF